MTFASTTAPTVRPPGPMDDEDLYEVVDGEQREAKPMSAFETILASRLCTRIENFANEHNLGVVATETLFVLNRDRPLHRRPDVAFVSFERWPKEQAIPRTNAWSVVPDLAVEIISATNLSEETDERIEEYLTAGVRLVWVFYPVSGRVYVFSSPEHCTRVPREGELTGEPVLPGFRLPISRLYDGLAGGHATGVSKCETDSAKSSEALVHSS